MAKFINYYRCPTCRHRWSDTWSAMVDDDCPDCGMRHISPYASEDLPSRPVTRKTYSGTRALVRMLESAVCYVADHDNDPALIDRLEQALQHIRRLAPSLQAPAAPRVVVVVEGGVVQTVLGNAEMEALLIDYDVNDEEDDNVRAVPQGGGRHASAVVANIPVSRHARKVASLFQLA